VALATVGSGVAGAQKKSSEPVTVRLGYFPNVTHAPALGASRAASSRRHWGRTRSM
jgi:hypothetical protein